MRCRHVRGGGFGRQQNRRWEACQVGRNWVLGNRTLVLYSQTFINVTKLTTFTHRCRFFWINKMAKGPQSVSQVAQSQSKMVHRVAVAEREEAMRKESKNLWKLQGCLWILTTKTLGVQIKSTWSPKGQLSDSRVFLLVQSSQLEYSGNQVFAVTVSLPPKCLCTQLVLNDCWCITLFSHSPLHPAQCTWRLDHRLKDVEQQPGPELGV